MHDTMAVLGAGSWGTALAIHLAKTGQPINLWGWRADELSEMATKGENNVYLPGIPFPESIRLQPNLSTALAGVKDIMVAVPSVGFASTLQQVKALGDAPRRILWVTKGLDPKKHCLLHQIVQETFGKDIPMAVLSGPSFAKEVAMGLPTAITLASHDEAFTADLVSRFHHDLFRVYTCDDLVGVQLGSAIKNVIAVAAGISDGLGFGANARSAIITRGLAEMVRLGLALGGKPQTFMGLAGMGDLVLTCTDDQSRNRRFGLQLGQGKNAQQAIDDIGQVVESADNALLVLQLARDNNIDMPITHDVCRVIGGEISARDAVVSLMSRAPKGE